MAKIKIREGSLEVELEGHGKVNDPGHPGGGPVRIEFIDYGTRYMFREGRLVHAEMDGEEEYQQEAL